MHNFVIWWSLKVQLSIKSAVTFSIFAICCLVTPCNAETDPIWQAYYDSTDIYWENDWGKSKQLLMDAKTYLEETLDHPEMDSTYNLSLNDLGICYFEMGRYEDALPLYKESLENTGNSLGKEHAEYGIRLNNLGVLYQEMGHYEDAMPLLLEATELTGKSLGKEHTEYGFKLKNLGNLYQEMGRHEEALALYIEALQITANTLGKVHNLYSVILNNLANSYYNMERYEEALPLYQEALENTANSLDKKHQQYGTRLNNLANLYLKMGRYKEALPLYVEALEIIANSLGKEHREYGTSLNNLGALFRKMGRYEEALPFYVEALEIIANSLGKEHPEYGIGLNNLGTLFQYLGRYEEALPLLTEALENITNSLGKEHAQYAIRLSNLGSLYRTMGRYEEAEALFISSIENTSNSLGKEHSQYGAGLNNLGSLYQKMGRFEEALPFYIEANSNLIRQVEKVFRLSNEKNKQDFLKTTDKYFREYQSFAYTCAYRFDTLNMMLYNNELLQKALVLNSTKQTINAIQKSGDSDLIIIFDNWKNIRSQLAGQYSTPISKRMDGIDSLERLANTLEEELVHKSSAFANINKQVSWREVREQLEDDEVAIEFVHFNNNGDSKKLDSILYVAMLITNKSDKPTIIPLFEERYLKKLLNKEDISDKKFVARVYDIDSDEKLLYKLLWSALEDELQNIQTVYFAATGLLHQINFSAIPHPNGGYLSNHFKLTQLSSTRQLVMRNEKPTFDRAIFYGGIEYEYARRDENTDSVDVKYLALNHLSQERNSTIKEFLYLRGTLKESERIQRLFQQKGIDVTLKSGKEATESDFKSMSGNSPKVIHIATHGIFLPDVMRPSGEGQRGASFKYIDNPLFRSGLALAGANYVWKKGYNPYEKEDGILTSYEISNMDLSNTDLVVLSACETGLGEIKGSEGVYGLQRAFRMAGVDNLIMSLWQVPDHQTTELMELFYANWLEGNDIREAFDMAQKTMSDRYPPYYWAAFVMVGDMVKQKKTRSRFIGWIVALGLISLIVLTYKFNKRNAA